MRGKYHCVVNSSMPGRQHVFQIAIGALLLVAIQYKKKNKTERAKMGTKADVNQEGLDVVRLKGPWYVCFFLFRLVSLFGSCFQLGSSLLCVVPLALLRRWRFKFHHCHCGNHETSNHCPLSCTPPWPARVERSPHHRCSPSPKLHLSEDTSARYPYLSGPDYRFICGCDLSEAEYRGFKEHAYLGAFFERRL
ncbi:hypothetical protein CPB83DRAFT_367108 [Crepidotus variabilis]|uniref:Uncharacterized protein n=1 Tax=Crepidotus variabilis TaxID=179855 RepID=A0A9P6EF31_9AGAR|nr:hypothetical protein CPB83DRAFT_367108 [Crepidotus variabilis]